MFVLADDLCFLVLVPDFAHDLFHQIFDRDQPGDAAIFVDHNRHADVAALHLAQKIADQLDSLVRSGRRGASR